MVVAVVSVAVLFGQHEGGPVALAGLGLRCVLLVCAGLGGVRWAGVVGTASAICVTVEGTLHKLHLRVHNSIASYRSRVPGRESEGGVNL